MTDGPTGAVYPDFEIINGEAFFVARMSPGADYLNRAPQSFAPKTHPFPTCDCSACEIRRLKDQIQQLTIENEALKRG